MLGAGGAARAIAVEAALAGAAAITIVNGYSWSAVSGLVALLDEQTEARAELVTWDRTYRRARLRPPTSS